jgi:nicotinamidase-related amidase
VRDTWGAELHPALVVDGPVVRKGVDGGDGYSGFSVRDPVSGDVTRTELGGLLEQHGSEQVVVVGLAGDVCVAATAEDAAGARATRPSCRSPRPAWSSSPRATASGPSHACARRGPWCSTP